MSIFAKAMIAIIMIVNFIAFSMFLFFQVFGEFLRTACDSFDSGIIAINVVILFATAMTGILMFVSKKIKPFSIIKKGKVII